MGYSINFETKSGRSNSVPDLIVVGNDEVLKKKETGVISKKKKKGRRYFGSTFCVIFGRKTAQSPQPSRC